MLPLIHHPVVHVALAHRCQPMHAPLTCVCKCTMQVKSGLQLLGGRGNVRDSSVGSYNSSIAAESTVWHQRMHALFVGVCRRAVGWRAAIFTTKIETATLTQHKLITQSHQQQLSAILNSHSSSSNMVQFSVSATLFIIVFGWFLGV